jgi:hypothetical protein
VSSGRKSREKNVRRASRARKSDEMGEKDECLPNACCEEPTAGRTPSGGASEYPDGGVSAIRLSGERVAPGANPPARNPSATAFCGGATAFCTGATEFCKRGYRAPPSHRPKCLLVGRKAGTRQSVGRSTNRTIYASWSVPTSAPHCNCTA